MHQCNFWPLGTLGSTVTRHTAPYSSEKPTNKNSDTNPAIFFGPKLTHPTTILPNKDSGV